MANTTNKPQEAEVLTDTNEKSLGQENIDLRAQVAKLNEQIAQYSNAYDTLNIRYRNLLEAYNMLFDGFINKGIPAKR